jgi:Geminivirus Rep catalytic domain
MFNSDNPDSDINILMSDLEDGDEPSSSIKMNSSGSEADSSSSHFSKIFKKRIQKVSSSRRGEPKNSGGRGRPRKYRLQSSQLFLTYPQCPVPKEEMYDFLFDKFQPEEIVVAHELHKNGDDHLHAYLKLSAKLDTSDPRFADYQEYHGNYQGCRSSQNVLKYCVKRDDYKANFDVEHVLDARKNKRRILYSKLINQEISLEDFIKENPTNVLGLKRLIGDLEEYRGLSYRPTMRDINLLWYFGSNNGSDFRTTKILLDLLGYDEWDESTQSFQEDTFLRNKLYFKNPYHKWFDKYAGEKIVYVTEYHPPTSFNDNNRLARGGGNDSDDNSPIVSGGGCGSWLTMIRQWINRLPFRPEMKGSSCWAEWNTVVFTSKLHPADIFRSCCPQSEINDLLERFEIIQVLPPTATTTTNNNITSSSLDEEEEEATTILPTTLTLKIEDEEEEQVEEERKTAMKKKKITHLKEGLRHQRRLKIDRLI